jgi:concanavalin A-like lectin/glucanase superfamily protein
MIRIFVLLFLSTLARSANAQQEVKALYSGNAGNITYAALPDRLRDLSGNGNDLVRSGVPVFFADAPADKKLKGEGSSLFKGDASYSIQKRIGNAQEKFILEVWVKATTPDNNDTHSGRAYGVLAWGNMSKGYVIAQQGSMWVILVDGKGTDVGPVAVDVWAHIAIVNEEGSVGIYVDGKKKGSVALAKSVANGFSIASAGNGVNFNGMVYAARLSTYEASFTAARHLLADTEKLQKKEKQEIEKYKSQITRIADIPGVSVVEALVPEPAAGDWLITPINKPVKVSLQKNSNGTSALLMISNGLISRSFYISGNSACVSLKNLSNGAEYVRAVKPEARVMIDSAWYDIGGLTGQPEKAYLQSNWYADMYPDPNAFHFTGMELLKPEARYPWQVKFNAVKTDWPPKGVHMVMHYSSPAAIHAVTIDIHYEVYEGMPVIRKWFTVKNGNNTELVVNKMDCEVLAIAQDQRNRLHVESDYSFAAVNNTTHASGSTLYPSGDTNNVARFGNGTTQWQVDRDYNTWATHNPAEDLFLGNPHFNLLVSTLAFGPAQAVAAGGRFESFSTFELLLDSDDRERQTMAHRKLYRRLAPQVTESLLTGGITSNDPAKLKSFIDQMHELGFERLDVMAWPGISHDNLDTGYIALWKDISNYGAARQIVVGGYELQIASRGRGAEFDCIDVNTGKPGSYFGQSVCIASKWQDIYFPKMWKFFDATGLRSYNMDGPYHGDACAATDHPHHAGYQNSQWQQWKFQVKVLNELQRRNMYVPIPDWYFLNGQSATGMGYREASANLTPQQQLLLGRQYIYDGTWHKAPTMGWMTLQLTGFYSNDPRIGLEPLSANLARYELGLFQHLASGAQFTVRGNRLYDTPGTKQMVKKWTSWFKKYREILTSDIIHLARPNGRDLDAIFHVNPTGLVKGMVIIFNPTDKAIETSFKLPLYYTGLRSKARVREQEGAQKEYTLDDERAVHVPVKISAGWFTWLVIE